MIEKIFNFKRGIVIETEVKSMETTTELEIKKVWKEVKDGPQ